MLLALCGPYMLTRDMKSVKLVYEFVTTVSSLLVIGLYVRYGRFSMPVKCLSLYMGWTYVVTFFISHNAASFYQVFLPIIAMVLLIELAFCWQGTGLLDAAVVFRLYVYVNLLLIFLFPAGVTGETRWLLGYRNMQAWSLLPIMTVLILLVIFGVWTGICGVHLLRERRSTGVNLLLALLLAFMVTGLTEALAVYMCPLLYAMLTLGMHSEQIAKLTQPEDQKRSA